MKKFKKFALVLICLATILGENLVSAKEDVVISNYTTDIVVTEKHKYLYNTTLDVNFHDAKKQFEFVVSDKGDTKNCKINNLKTTEEKYRLSKKGSETTLNITSSVPYPKEKKIFEISYDVSYTKDDDKNYDFAHIPIVESALKHPVTNVYCTISLPTDKIEAVTLTSAKNEEVKNVSYIVDGSTIIVTACDIEPKQNVSLMIKMPEGTFKKAPNIIFSKSGVYAFIILLIVILASLYVLIMFFFTGRDDKIVLTKEYYAPDNLTPIETEYAYTRTITAKSCAAMVLYWAIKGYLKILRHDNKNYSLVKLKEIDKNALEYQKEAFKELFNAGNGTVVTGSQLENKYYNTVDKMKSSVSTSFMRERLLDNIKTEKFSYIGLIVLILAGITTILIASIANSAPISTMSVSAVLYVLASGVIYKFFKFASNKVYNNLYLSITGIATTVIAFSVAFLLGSYINSASVLNPLTVVVSLGVVIAIQSVAALINQKTDYASGLLGKIKGFRDFIKNPDSEKISSLLKENDMYFYDILPYAVSFGKTEKWAAGFKTEIVKPPYMWYESDNDLSFRPETFAKEISELITLMSEKSFSYYYVKKDNK